MLEMLIYNRINFIIIIFCYKNRLSSLNPDFI